MSSQYLKAHRKYAKENYKVTLDEVLQTACEENVFQRIWFGLKIVFKVYKKKPVKKTVKMVKTCTQA